MAELITQKQIFEGINAILKKQLHIKKDSEIALEAEIINDLGADSLQCVEIQLAIEDKYLISIPDEDLLKMEQERVKVGDVVNYVHKRLYS